MAKASSLYRFDNVARGQTSRENEAIDIDSVTCAQFNLVVMCFRESRILAYKGLIILYVEVKGSPWGIVDYITATN